MKAVSNVSTWTASRYVRSTAFMRVRTCSSSIRTNASIAVFASLSARLMRSEPDTEPGLEKWLEINTQYAQVWPNITVKREPPPDAKDWEGKPDKANLLSPNPGTGD